jgi:serine protease Do
VNHGWIGVRIQKVTADIAENLNIKPPRGALVADLDDQGPAKAAGIQSGDVIVRFNGIDILEPRDLSRLVTETAVGKVALMLIIRSGKEQFKAVRVGALASQGNPTAK